MSNQEQPPREENKEIKVVSETSPERLLLVESTETEEEFLERKALENERKTELQEELIPPVNEPEQPEQNKAISVEEENKTKPKDSEKNEHPSEEGKEHGQKHGHGEERKLTKTEKFIGGLKVFGVGLFLALLHGFKTAWDKAAGNKSGGGGGHSKPSGGHGGGHGGGHH